MKTSYRWVRPNKCRTRKFRIGFLAGCQNWYWDPIEVPLWGKPPVEIQRLIWCYDYGFRNGYLDIAFGWFKEIVLERMGVEETLYPRVWKPHNGRWRRGRGSQDWFSLRFGEYRVGTKYVRHDHEPKEREEIDQRQAWRIESGKDRNSRKVGYRRGVPRFYKKKRSSEHRQWVREQIHRENWDAFHDREREGFVDSWTWD